MVVGLVEASCWVGGYDHRLGQEQVWLRRGWASCGIIWIGQCPATSLMTQMGCMRWTVKELLSRRLEFRASSIAAQATAHGQLAQRIRGLVHLVCVLVACLSAH